jgi:transposase
MGAQHRQRLVARDLEIERLRRELAERDEQIRRQADQIAEQQKQIADLERQLALREQNSTASSKPPSSDGLAGTQRERGRRKKSRRKPGGQPGHAGHCRPLLPAERVNQVVQVLPAQCRHCHRALPQTESDIAVQGEPRRHQVTELPPIQAHVTEYQCPKVVCPECGKTTQEPLPKELEDGFGPQLTALIAYLTVVCRMPRRVVEAFLEQALQIPISLGSTQKAWEETSAAVAAACQELEQELKNQPVLNSDETGHRTNGEKRWLWALVAPAYVYYYIAASRGAAVLVRLLGEVFAGILCSDRCPSYAKYHRGRLQYCWAHFKRNILGVLEIAKTTEAERFCRDALALHARLFRLWHRFRGDPVDRRGNPKRITRQQLIEQSIPLQKKLFALAQRYLDSKDKDVRNLATALFVHFEKFFVFVEHEGVEPTNNSVERALRIAVQWRKIMLGTRSVEGEVAVARLLTVTQTCRRQRRNALGYLANAIRCHRRGHAPASLLPKNITP